MFGRKRKNIQIQNTDNAHSAIDDAIMKSGLSESDLNALNILQEIINRNYSPEGRAKNTEQGNTLLGNVIDVFTDIRNRSTSFKESEGFADDPNKTFGAIQILKALTPEGERFYPSYQSAPSLRTAVEMGRLNVGNIAVEDSLSTALANQLMNINTSDYGSLFVPGAKFTDKNTIEGYPQY